MSENRQSQTSSIAKLDVPSELRQQLHGYRRHVWTIKLIEAITAACFTIISAYLVVFLLDRVFDTPDLMRALAFVAAVGGFSLIPWAAHRWVWRHRHLEQLARLLSRKLPSIGDQLLGIIELAANEAEQAKSPALCAAAFKQVAADAGRRDLDAAAPSSHYRVWSILAGGAVMLATMLAVLFPGAASNAWGRLLAPWLNVPRYTFTKVEPLPQRMVVPHGESFTIELPLLGDSLRQPPQGELQVGSQPTLTAKLQDSRYTFNAPPQIDPLNLSVSIGDFKQIVRLEPTLRPELESVSARISLPSYLGHPALQSLDLRGGILSAVQGSVADVRADANRTLATAAFDDRNVQPENHSFVSGPMLIDADRTVSLRWADDDGLAGRAPFEIRVRAIEDESPTVACEGLSNQAIVLESEVLNFQIRAGDDFGVKRVGIEWRSVPNDNASQLKTDAPPLGERVLAAGDFEQTLLTALGTFCATALEISPQPIELRIWAEDYFPNRPRGYSSSHILFILTADQHAIWMAEQMNKWQRESLEVRDRELQLHEVNKQLRDLSPEELDEPETRQRIEAQASAEHSNSRRLAALTQNGAGLLRQAARNKAIGVGHLDRWAEMLKVLEDISQNRMPSVSELLKTAAKAPNTGASDAKSAPSAGQVRASPPGGKPPGETLPTDTPPPPVPQVVDTESSQQPPNEVSPDEQNPEPPKPPKKGRLGLAQTTLIGPGGKPNKKPEEEAKKAVADAVTEQAELLAEFEKVADELNDVLANLEGSTLVKRLKAASRVQYLIGGQIAESLEQSFGKLASGVPEAQREKFSELATKENDSSQKLSNIMDDLQAFFERRQMIKFGSILEEMKQADVIDGLRQLGHDIPIEHGLSVAQCEFWSDTLDRWAEDLVDPACSGCCSGCKTPDSLPPSVVLEVLQVLEAEVNLREETRVTEQAKQAVGADRHREDSQRLGEQQSALKVRISKVIEQIEGLPNSEEHFGKDIALLSAAKSVMSETVLILRLPDTGKQAIAAETEVIELLLQSKRINPKGGGGGGESPGGGGNGSTKDFALALLGSGFNDKEVRKEHEVQQTTGETGNTLPPEFRSGLDQYFNRLQQ